LNIAAVEEIQDDPELRRAWNELARRMEHPEVFYTYEWAVAVQRSYRSSLTPLVFLAYEGESLLGVVAFARENASPRSVTFLTAATADYCDFISDPLTRPEFVDAVFSELRRQKIEKIVLANLPADSSSVAVISASASRHRFHPIARPAYLCARVVLGSAEQRAALKRATCSKKKLRRNLRVMEEQAPVVFRHDSRWEEIEPLLPSFSKAHVARFLATGRISNLARAARRVFLYELARELSRSGWMSLSRLLIGEIPVAWNYGFQFAGSWFWYQPTLNIAYEDLSPGFCLLSKIVEAACDLPDIDIVDLGLGAEDYKTQFATANRQTLYIALDRSFPGYLRAATRDHAAALVKASPQIERRIRTWIRRIAGLRAHLQEGNFAALLSWLNRRIWGSLVAFDEVSFFEWPGEYEGPRVSKGVSLRQLDFDLLAAAAIHYADEAPTMGYLLRSAQRLRLKDGYGVALIALDGTPVHFCWVKDFEGFRMAELERNLHAPCPEAVMIFDCFTPPSARGHGLFADAISALADQLHSEKKAPWIFGAATNLASLRGIQKSGFTYRFSLGRSRILFLKRTKDSPSTNIARSVHAP